MAAKERTEDGGEAMGNADQLIVGCGEFGGAVLAHLEVRQAPDWAPVALCAVTGPASSRAAGRELAEAQAGHIAQRGATRIHLVASADEPAGSGVLTALLSRFGRDRQCEVWLALPTAGADRAAQARSYATLVEVEALRASGLVRRISLCDQRAERLESAQVFGDAILWTLSMVTRPEGYLGFGFGVVRDPLASLQRRMAPPVAKRGLEQYLQQPDPPHLLAGVRPGLMEPIRRLLLPLEICPAFSSERALASGRSLTLEQLFEHYDLSGEWYRRASLFWEQLRQQAQRQLSTALGQAWRGGFEAIYSEAQTGLGEAHNLLEQAIQETENLVRQYEETLVAARQALSSGGIDPDEIDRLLAGYMLEGLRLMSLERFALAYDGVIELVMDGLRAKVEQIRSLCDQVGEFRESTAIPRLAHALQLTPSAEQEREWLSAIDPRRTRAVFAEHAQPTVTQLIDAARQDVRRFVRTQGPLVELPRGHRVREAWLGSTEPGVSLLERQRFSLQVSRGLPESYTEELAARAGGALAVCGDWIPGEWAVYAETGPLDLGQLALLAGWREVYSSAPARLCAELHAIPEPHFGWPDLRTGRGLPLEMVAPGVQPPPVQDLGPARDLVRACLLGQLQPVEEVASGGSGQHPSLWAALDALKDGAEVVGGARSDWLTLAPRELAAYFALLRWFQTAVLDGDRGLVDQQFLLQLHQATEQERADVRTRLASFGEEWPRTAVQMVAQIGGPNDDFTEQNGSWRAVRRRSAE